MAIYRVQAPDGSVLRIEGPDNASSQEIEQFAAQQFKPKGKTWDEKVAFERGKLQEEHLKEMGPFERARAGFGKAFTDTAQGISQFLGRTPTSEVDEERKLSQALMDDPAAIAGNLAGGVAQSVAIPGGSTVKGAALVGGAMAGAQPVASGESRGFNTAVGAGLGAAGQGVARTLGKVATGPKNVLTPAEQELARKAEEQGIALTAGQKTGNKFLQTVESQMERMPATSAKATEQKLAQSREFTTALNRQMGAEADNIGEDVMSATRKRLGDNYEEIFKDAKIDLNREPVLAKLSEVADEAKRFLPDGDAKIVLNRIDEILEKTKDGLVEGKAYQKWRSSATSKNGDVNNYLKQAKKAVDDAAAESLGPETMAKYAKTNEQYKAMKTLQPLAAESASGLASPGRVMGRVKSQYPNMAFGGAGEMGDLAKIGSRFVRDQTPDSGTSQRALAQALMTGGAGTGIGAITGAVTGDPMAGLGAGAATIASRTALPKMAQMLLNNPKVQAYLAEGGLMKGKKVDPRLIELLLKGSAGAPVGGWLALSQ